MGIDLKPEDFSDNPGMRQLAKLMLNSLWGKFGMRRNFDQNQFCTNLSALAALFNDETITVSNIIPVAENVVIAVYKKADLVFQELNNNSNVFIAAATTAYARMELYKYLDIVKDRAVYCDTDSIVYISDEGHDCPRGDNLGELKSELKSGDFITEFVTGGPKNYAYKTEKGDICVKVKGFSLNFVNQQAFTLENIKTVVESFAKLPGNEYVFDIDGDEIIIPILDESSDDDAVRLPNPTELQAKLMKKREKVYKDFHQHQAGTSSATAGPDYISVHQKKKIIRDGTWNLLSAEEQKFYSVNYTKRVTVSGFNTVPYGY